MKFRKLHINLPGQPVVNEKPWLIAGWLLAVVLLIVAALMYFSHKKGTVLQEQQIKMILHSGWCLSSTNYWF